MSVKRFPIFKAGYIFNEFKGTLKENYSLKYSKVMVNYPCRLDAMAIDPSAVCYNDDMIFTPGEVVISANMKIKVTVKLIDKDNGNLVISKTTKRKVLVKHAYYLITKVLKVNPSLEIDVYDNDIPKHCGFGSSSSTITAVASAINELYGCPIKNSDLIKYLASNHGEEIDNANENDLKLVQSIGGGATNGLVEQGIIIIAGRATTIAKMKYEADVLIGLPNDFIQKNADELMKLEEDNLWKFGETGKKYAKEIAYNLLHKALPDMVNGKIDSLAKVVFDYRFDMGSINNCSFVYEKMNDDARILRKLYEDKHCEFLSLSSVGPAFFVLVNDEKQKQICKKTMEDCNMKVMETTVCNNTYECEKEDMEKVFWEKESTAKEFTERPASKYITDAIDEVLLNKEKNIKALDIGCGGGRYSRYLSNIVNNVYAIDRYEQMAFSVKNTNISFAKANMDNIPFEDNMFDLIISIGVVHNAVTIKEFNNSIKEINRLLKPNSRAILSVFTNDVITNDLIKTGENLYNIVNRPPMVLLSKKQIDELLAFNNLHKLRVIDEHITDVGGGGSRNVYSVLLQKQ